MKSTPKAAFGHHCKAMPQLMFSSTRPSAATLTGLNVMQLEKPRRNDTEADSVVTQGGPVFCNNRLSRCFSFLGGGRELETSGKQVSGDYQGQWAARLRREPLGMAAAEEHF